MHQVVTKAVIWDLDGTLVDSLHFFIEVCEELFPRYGYQVPSEDNLRRHYHGKLGDTLAGILPNCTPEQVDELTEGFISIQDPHYEHMERHLYADAISLAQRLHAKGVLQIVVSNREHKGRGNGSPKSIITKPPLDGVFDLAICGDDNPFHKPDPRVLNDVMEQYELSTTDFTVIGDQFVDAHLAMNLEAQAVLVNRHTEDIPHLERLGDDWQQHVTLVSSLDQIQV